MRTLSGLSPRRAALLLAVSLAPATGCEKTVPIALNLIEPFDQQNQALSSVQSLRVEYRPEDPDTGLPNTDPETGNAVTLTRDDTASPTGLAFSLDERVFLTVRAYEGDITTDPSLLSQPPDSIGRTVPVEVDLAGDLDVTLPVGIFDSFGQTTTRDEEGNTSETFLDSGEAVPGRHGHTATYLPTLGKVLIVGGATWNADPQADPSLPQCKEFDGVRKCLVILRTVELYDPDTGLFETVPGTDILNPRAYHTATLLPDGRVLIAGGFTYLSQRMETLVNGFIFDPNNLEAPFSSPVIFVSRRAMHTAVLIDDQGDAGQVALIGGCHGTGCTPFGSTKQGPNLLDDPVQKVTSVVEIFDIAASASTSVPLEEAFEQQIARMMHASTRMGDFIVISGGLNGDDTICTVEILAIQAGSLGKPAGYPDEATRLLPECPAGHTQVTIFRDTVAIIGGVREAPNGVVSDASVPSSRVQLWRTTGAGTEIIEMLSGRVFHQSVLLADGSILNIGGRIPLGGASAEKLRTVPGGTFSASPVALPLASARRSLAVAPMPNNQVLVTGGYDEMGVTSERAEIYFAD